MNAKKNADGDAGEPTEVLDDEAVEADAADAPPEVVVEVEDAPAGSIIEAPPVPDGDVPTLEDLRSPMAVAQGIIGVPVTGFNNHGTKMGLRGWQRAHGLPPTGQLDARTKNAMHI